MPAWRRSGLRSCSGEWRALFVAGSASDIDGARGAGMDVCWHNRRLLPLGEHEAPLMELGWLEPLIDLVAS